MTRASPKLFHVDENIYFGRFPGPHDSCCNSIDALDGAVDPTAGQHIKS